MQTHRNKEVTSSLFSSSSVKNEETISMCAVKREMVPTCTEEMCHPASSPGKRPLIDIRHEISTPHMKRTKQENEPRFWEGKESISFSRKTSLQSIVSEVAHSFENNADIYESIPTSQRNKKSCLDNVNRTFSNEKDTVVFQHKDRERICFPQIAEDVNEVAVERESHKASMPSVDIGKKEISVLSIADHVEAETTKPILRTIKCSDSGKSEGFAYDHNFFPKLVGVHSISSPLSCATETGFQMKTQCSPPVLEKPREHQNTNAEEPVDVYEVKPCAASSQTNQIPRDSRSPESSASNNQEECDLLFSFTQDDGKSDLFLVVKDEVFSVKRFYYKGESYLIHTDNRGKTSILAKAPKEGKGESQDGRSTSEATGLGVSNNPTRSTNVSTIVSELSRQTTLQRTPPHQPAPPSIRNPTLQSSYDRIADLNAQETSPATCGQHQLAHDNTRMLRRLLSNAEQRAEPCGSRPQLLASQQRLLSQTRADRHQVVVNDSLQNSTTVAISAPFQASTVLNTSSNILRNQHLITNQDSAVINQPTHNKTNKSSQQRHTKTTVQTPYSGHNAVSSGEQRYQREEIIEVDNYRKPTFVGLSGRRASEINESRVEKRKELMRYITNQLASSGNQVPSASNSPELINLVTKGREVRSRQPYGENVAKGNGSSNSRNHEMAGLRQHQDNGAPLPPRHAEGHSISNRSASGVGTNTGVCDVGARYHPRQRVGQDSADLHSPPQSDVPHPYVDLLQGSIQSNSETEGNSKVLQIIESWKRRQQPYSSSNTFRQLRELLTRVDGSAETSQNTNSLKRKETLNKPSQEAHPSNVARDTPVISQISYGVISRSTDGENVTPKRTATALVIDQRHSIYVDATDSVMDERKTPVNTGQQFSNAGNTVSDCSYQSEKVATSFPVSSGSTVRSWLQETEPPVNSNTTSGQRPIFSSKLSQNPAKFSDQRFYNLEMLPRKTVRPKVDKRCVANNTLSPVPVIPAQTNRLPHERNFLTSLVSGQQSYFNKAPVQSSPKIASPSEATKPCEVPSYGVSDVAGPSEAAKFCQFVMPREAATGNGKTGAVDVVEIIDSPPTQDSLPSPPTDSDNNEDSYNTVCSQRSCVNEAPSSSTAHDTMLCHAENSKTDDVVEIINSPLKGDSIDHVTVNKNSLNSQSEEDEQTRINALRAELMRKIQNTNDRIAQENIDWKKKYLNRLKVALTKKLAKLPSAIDVTVIDDD